MVTGSREPGALPMTRRMGLRTSTVLVFRVWLTHEEGEPPMPDHAQKPGVKEDLLLSRGVNPNRMRKGKSGEIPRRGPR